MKEGKLYTKAVFIWKNVWNIYK